MAYWVVSKHSVPQISDSYLGFPGSLQEACHVYTQKTGIVLGKQNAQRGAPRSWTFFPKTIPNVIFSHQHPPFPSYSLSLSLTHTHSSSSSQKPAPRGAEPENRPSSAGMREQTGLEDDSQWKIQVDFTAQVLDEDRMDFQK